MYPSPLPELLCMAGIWESRCCPGVGPSGCNLLSQADGAGATELPVRLLHGAGFAVDSIAGRRLLQDVADDTPMPVCESAQTDMRGSGHILWTFSCL